MGYNCLRMLGRSAWASGFGTLGVGIALLLTSGCSDENKFFDSDEPERGLSELLPSRLEPLTNGDFAGGNDNVPVDEELDWQPETPIRCGDACLASCDAMGFDNPVNKGLCTSLWGPGGTGTPIVAEEACRRLWVDTQGRFPTRTELTDECLDRPWSEVVRDLIDSEAFVRLNRRMWADRLRYDTEAVSVERIFDMDRIVEAVYEGKIAYDHFAALVSAHPVLTRRHDTSGDRAEAIIWLLLGRPPFGDERADLGRLYALWQNDYYDHPQLGMRLPDAYVRYRCVNDNGKRDPNRAGECTSTEFGFQELILEPDARARDGRDAKMMWSGLLTANEWEQLQAPGRLLAEDLLFWENAARVVMEQYLGYDMGSMVPEVADEMARFILANDGDIRSLHFAVLTSAPYLQSARGDRDPALRYTYGPMKQIDAEGWVDSMSVLTGKETSVCDLRLNRPGDFLDSESPSAHALIASSEWTLNEEGRLQTNYRDLVRNLGGCPDNSQGGRFKIVSVLTTANQLNHASRICDPALDQDGNRSYRASIDELLPSGVESDDVLSEDMAADIFQHLTRRFFSRSATSAELEAARGYGTACLADTCTAEAFARPTCYALLSSAEMLFY